MQKPIAPENKDTPAKAQPTKRKFLPIVFTSQMARNHIDTMNAKVAEVKALYPRMFAPAQPTLQKPSQTGEKK